jgi:hypothetical protein
MIKKISSLVAAARALLESLAVAGQGFDFPGALAKPAHQRAVQIAPGFRETIMHPQTLLATHDQPSLSQIGQVA